MTVRDELGRVEAAMCRNLDASFEARLLSTQDINIRDIVVESDSLIMVQALNGISAPPSTFSVVIQSILYLNKGFCRAEFSHVKSQGNRPTHALAKHVLNIVNFILRHLPF